MEKWFPFLKEEETQIFSPRVEAVLAKIKDIRKPWPGEKVVVVSEFVLFLDIIKEAIERRSKTNPNLGIRLAEYNGTVNLEERSRVQYAFNLPTGGPEVLLLTVGAGGVGLNLARGNRASPQASPEEEDLLGLNLARATHINTEPFWTLWKLNQIIRRARWLPQDKTVHIWHMRAHPSEIDLFVLNRQAQKVHFVRQLLHAVTGEADIRASD
ncbi:uncharacterized protein FFB14_00973 [Fusarium fujikuroi]|nr:uncharacterized protein FFB14_00973 [Fusarium fujikuroi]